MREHIYTIEYNTSIFKIAHMDISGNAYIFQLQITVLQLLRILNKNSKLKIMSTK